MPACMKLPLGAALLQARLAAVAPALERLSTVYVITLPVLVFKRVCCLMLFAMCVCELVLLYIKKGRPFSPLCVTSLSDCQLESIDEIRSSTVIHHEPGPVLLKHAILCAVCELINESV